MRIDWVLGLLAGTALSLAGHATSLETPTPAVSFVDVTDQAGISFLHRNSPTPERYLVETMGSGCAFIDFDGDGYLDLFLVNGGATPSADSKDNFDHALYRNRRDGTFELVTRKAGIAANKYYGMGVAVGDFQNDGHDDLFITNFNGPNILYRNNGDGTFTDVTEAAGVAGDGRWSSSAIFFDYDNDGFLDLYVVRYLNHSFANNRVCGPLDRGVRAYCTPHAYDGVPDLLYHNNGDGTFTDVSRQAGVALAEGKGLGVTALDYDRDGFMDLYVANDSVPNFLLRNDRKGSFEEKGLVSGTGMNSHGQPQAGMGAAAGDFDGDGRIDLAVTNLDFEYLALYRNLGNGFFEEVSGEAGVELSSRPFVGFGIGFFDYDNDGDLDLLEVNGNVLDNAPLVREGATYQQRKLLLENLGGHFRDVTASLPELMKAQVARGLALGDYDNDGDLDALVTHNGGRAVLLENRGGNRRSWLTLKLVGKRSNRNAFGALVELRTGQRKLVRQVTASGSYLSSGDYRVHFGLGAHREAVDLTITWPGGSRSLLKGVLPGQFLTVAEETGPQNEGDGRP